jgi:predicted esterase
MQTRGIKVPKSARYVTLGQPTTALKQIWYVFHGYGQLATDFIQEFAYIADGSRYFIAPEGLSRFYCSGSSGRVGASWMTREDRLDEISDYLTYTNAVYEKVTREIPHESVKNVLLGFSQGVSTVCRWLEQVSVRVDRLILWAGTIPPELDLWKIRAHYPKLEVFMVVGTQDPFAKPGTIKEEEERLEKFELNYQKIRFEGKHELHPPTLRKLSDF